MQCSKCKIREAQKYTRRSGDKEVTVYLCPACYDLLYPAGDSDELFTALLGNLGESEKACPHCGITLLDFRRTGLLGCAHCYTAFRNELIPTVQYIQGKLQHDGKAQSEEAREKYDMMLALVKEQEMEKERLRRAEERGDTTGAARARKRLGEIDRRLGEET